MAEIPLTKSRRYRNFKAERDKALEQLLYRAKLEINDVLRGTFTQVIEFISYRYVLSGGHTLSQFQINFNQNIERGIDQIFSQAEPQVSSIIKKLKRLSYTLSYAGETEAIGRAYEIVAKHTIDYSKKDLTHSVQGEDIDKRIHLAFARIKRKIMDAIELSWVIEESPQEAIKRIKDAFPKRYEVKRPAKVLKQKPFQEAQSQRTAQFSSGLMDEDDWDDMLDWYDSKYVPKWRAPDDEWGTLIKTEDGDLMYGWEIEQEMTHDFVADVRDGEIDAAKENGITDFSWIAILDNKTDECCRYRDGLTSKQIEDALNSGKLDKETCDAVVPPAHFKCRCRIAPSGDKEVDETPDLDKAVEDFNEWIKRKEAQ